MTVWDWGGAGPKSNDGSEKRWAQLKKSWRHGMQMGRDDENNDGMAPGWDGTMAIMAEYNKAGKTAKLWQQGIFNGRPPVDQEVPRQLIRVEVQGSTITPEDNFLLICSDRWKYILKRKRSKEKVDGRSRQRTPTMTFGERRSAKPRIEYKNPRQ